MELPAEAEKYGRILTSSLPRDIDTDNITYLTSRTVRISVFHHQVCGNLWSHSSNTNTKFKWFPFIFHLTCESIHNAYFSSLFSLTGLKNIFNKVKSWGKVYLWMLFIKKITKFLNRNNIKHLYILWFNILLPSN